MASSARIRVVRVEHGRPPSRPKEAPVALRRARVGKRGSVDASLAARSAVRRPGREDGARLRRREARVIRTIERADDRRGRPSRSRWNPRRRASNRAQIGVGGPPSWRCNSCVAVHTLRRERRLDLFDIGGNRFAGRPLGFAGKYAGDHRGHPDDDRLRGHWPGRCKQMPKRASWAPIREAHESRATRRTFNPRHHTRCERCACCCLRW